MTASRRLATVSYAQLATALLSIAATASGHWSVGLACCSFSTGIAAARWALEEP